MAQNEDTTHKTGPIPRSAGNDYVLNGNCGDISPSIRSTSLTYTNGPLWLGAAYQDHSDWTASSIGTMEGSDAESMRLAGRYIFDLGGATLQLSAMYESVEYEFNNIVNFDGSLGVLGFGYSGTYVHPNYGLKHTAETAIKANDSVNMDPGADDPTVGADDTIDPVQYAASDRTGTGNLYTTSRNDVSRGNDLKFERDAWMLSGKVNFEGPWDFRFSYMQADDLEMECTACTGDWQDSGADAFNVGMFYTMPAGTELRVTYSEISNDDNGTYGQGINGSCIGGLGNKPRCEVEMFALGIVHWFD